MKTNVKKILLGASLALLGTFAGKAQVGLEGIIVEKYYQVNANDIANHDANGDPGKLATGAICYRVYADLAPGWKFLQMWSNSTHAWKITTTTTFYNSPNSDIIFGAQGTGTNQVRQNTRMIDSYLTIGGAANGKAGITKVLDPDGSIGGFTSGVMQNTVFPPALTTADGFAPGVLTTTSTVGNYVAITALGLGNSTDSHVFDALQTPGGSFVSNGGLVAGVNGAIGTSTANYVLLGQFTTDGVFGFEFNVQVQNTTTSASENWVANNPQSGEFTMSALTLAPPTVTVTSPANNANIVTGTQLTITAGANDNGTVTSVDFRVDGVSIGVDNSSPFAASYTAALGTHTITAIATDNDALTATSAPVVIHVANNQVPTVTVTAPSGAKVGDLLTFTATATDPDGTVASVSFSVDNVAIGTTTLAPYTATWTGVLGAHQVRASAIDNNSAVGLSAPVAFNVLNNTPPTVAITSPTNGASFVTATPSLVTLTITALATDPDGTVTSVEFLVNSVSVGTVTGNGPYTFTYSPSIFGLHSLTAKATDNNSSVTTSAPVVVNIVNANQLPYEIGAVKQKCNQGNFYLPISAASTYTVDNVIGYDVELLYDAARVLPTGSVNVTTNLINPAYVNIFTTVNNGTMNISASFNGSAPGNAEFFGNGELFLVEFNKISMTDVDTARFTVNTIDESKFIGVSTQTATAGRYTTFRDTMYNGRLRFPLNNAVMPYDVSQPNNFLITNVYASNSSCVTNTLGTVQPNLAGNFVYNILKGSFINIDRDINNGQSVQSVIGNADATICRQVLQTSTLIPSVYQIIALDVNMDGIISSGDLSQINQRSVLSIGEYKQAWNHDATGTKTLIPSNSKDYMFVDSIRIASNPAYAISATYPLNDNTGYSRFKVPSTPFCLAVNQTSLGTCPTLLGETYRGIMLGDANLSIATAAGTLLNRPSSDNQIVIDLSKSVSHGNTVEVPVTFVSTKPVMGVDFAVQFDQDNLTYNQMVNYPSKTDALAYLNPNDKTLRFTATNVDITAFDKDLAVASIRFETTNGVIDPSQITGVLGVLNDEVVPVVILNKTVGVTSVNADNSVSIYPNPTNGILNITSISDAQVQLMDVTGKVVLLETTVTGSHTKSINVSDLANGVYIVKISNSEFSTVKKVVLSK